MRFKKVLSVFLATLMLFSVMSLGFTGMAAEIDYDAQYEMLADALRNEHVRDLTNYTSTNEKLNDDETEGFNQEARGFAYDHKVVARDNDEGDILKASNRFYYIAEGLMSYRYGVGCYDVSTLLSYMTEKLRPLFSEDVLYEDFYGNRYYATAEEIAAYNAAVAEIEAAGREVDKISLPEYGIYFIHKDEWEYYNVESILRYFMGNVVKVNVGNWYHKFSFVVQTSVSTVLEDGSGLPDEKIVIRTAAYEISYQKYYNESMSKAYFAFEEPSLERVWESYGEEYDLDRTPVNLAGPGMLLDGGQASAYLINQTVDDTTGPYLAAIDSAFNYFLYQEYAYADEYDNWVPQKKWDEVFVNLTDAEIRNPSAYADILLYDGLTDTVNRAEEILGYAKYLTDNLSNEALQSVFGEKLGSMVTLAYLFKRSAPDYSSVDKYTGKTFAEKQNAAMADTANPSRTIIGTDGGYTAKYIASDEVINDIIFDIDALISPREGEDAVNDKYIANRVVSVVSSLLDIGDLLGIEGEVQYDSLEELIGIVVNELVFTDSIVNMLVGLLYPMLADLLTDLLGDLTGIGVLDGAISDLLNSVLTNNDLAIYPHELAERIEDDYDGKYSRAAAVLAAAKNNSWDNVVTDALYWGVDDAPTEQKAEAFLDAVCAGLGGFNRLLITFLCGDFEYNDTDMQDVSNIGRYYDIKLIPALSAWLVSQGLYTKLFIPLYRVLGIPEPVVASEEYDDGVMVSQTLSSQGLFLTSYQYHRAVVNDYNVVLKEALRPIISWITECVAKKPIETVMKLVPNLVHFLSRKSTVNLSYESDWEKPSFATAQDDCHKGFSQLQSYSLIDIIDHVYLSITGIIGVNIYTTSLFSLIGEGTLGMLTSLNALLNEVISFGYEVGEGSPQINAYYDNKMNVVPKNSEEYALNPDKYPNPSLYYYSNEDHTSFSLTEDEIHTEKHEDRVYDEEPFYIPAVPEAKLVSCGTVYSPTTHNTLIVDNPGRVFKFLLRYVLSAVGYKFNSADDFTTLPSVIECLGLGMDDELFLGLTLGDIITNVMLHPDEALCALLELFYTGEVGDLYHDIADTYPVEPIEYYNETLLNPIINPTLTYGTEVKYSQYWTKEYADDFIASLTPLAEDVLVMIGLEGVEDGLGAFLENMLNDLAFNDDIVNMLFNLIYQLIADLAGGSFDIEGLLWSVFDVSFDTGDIANALDKMLGYTSEASATIRKANNWAEIFEAVEINEETGEPVIDEETGEVVMSLQDVDLKWGITPAVKEIIVDEETGEETIVYEELALCEQGETPLTRADAMLRTLSALLSPAAFVLKFLFMDQNLSVLGLVNLPGYAGYQYAFIGLLEALSCPNILPYDDYYEASLDPDCGDANVIYYLFAPLLGLVEKVYVDPLNTVLSLIPNLLFFISIGGFNDLVNNLVHFAYVLLDMLKPILNAYDLVGGLLANIDISGMSLNLSLPLDIDFNSLISDLLGSLLGDTLTIEGVSIKLPYIDLYTLCVGTLEAFTSKEGRPTVHLNAAGGGTLLTALLRIVFEVLFMDENHVALSQIIANLAEEGRLDAYDEETLYLVINGLIGLIEEYEVLDIILMAVYLLVSNLVPIADTLTVKLQENDMTITDLIDSIDDMDLFMEKISKLLGDGRDEIPGEIDDGKAAMSLLDKIIAFFEKIKLFFQRLFAF